MKPWRMLFGFWLLATACNSQVPQQAATANQDKPEAYNLSCEGCAAALEGPAQLSHELTIAGEQEPGERIVLRGRVLQPDGRTPAAGIVLYFHHTNAKGIYPPQAGARGWAAQHGYLRGWLRTNAQGEYILHTIKPGPYPVRPGSTMPDPAHIHITVAEPGWPPYWIEDFMFEGDSRLTPAYRQQRLSGRGGSGIVTLTQANSSGTWVATRDIVLRKNLPRKQ